MTFPSLPMSLRIATVLLCAALGACASKHESGYGLGIQAERQAELERTSQKNALPDTPGMYLALIEKMQGEGMFYASLAHIDAYEKQHGRTPDTILLRADALRQTEQPEASRAAYAQLLQTPLAARGYRGLGLLLGQAGNFAEAARQFEAASTLAPTDALILSDLGYALLRAGEVPDARVPLMKASELARDNPKIQRNLILYFLADGQADTARSIIARQNLSADAQRALDASLKQVVAAAKARAS